MMTRKKLVLSTSLAIALAGCAADAEPTEPVDPATLTALPTQGPDREHARGANDQVAPQTIPGDMLKGGVGGAAGSGAGPRGVDPTCPVWGCGTNHNRRLVRV